MEDQLRAILNADTDKLLADKNETVCALFLLWYADMEGLGLLNISDVREDLIIRTAKEIFVKSYPKYKDDSEYRSVIAYLVDTNGSLFDLHGASAREIILKPEIEKENNLFYRWVVRSYLKLSADEREVLKNNLLNRDIFVDYDCFISEYFKQMIKTS